MYELTAYNFLETKIFWEMFYKKVYRNTTFFNEGAVLLHENKEGENKLERVGNISDDEMTLLEEKFINPNSTETMCGRNKIPNVVNVGNEKVLIFFKGKNVITDPKFSEAVAFLWLMSKKELEESPFSHSHSNFWHILCTSALVEKEKYLPGNGWVEKIARLFVQ